MKKCNKCGQNLLPTSNFDEYGKPTHGTICENEECITHSNGYDAEDAPATLEEELEAIGAKKMMQMLGNEKAILQNSHPRTKGRWITAILRVQPILDLLGYKIVKK